MKAYRTEIDLPENGVLTLTALPFETGQRVEIIVLPVKKKPMLRAKRPLRGKVLRYDCPFDPVAENDWEALK